jgi:hypothetical protein
MTQEIVFLDWWKQLNDALTSTGNAPVLFGDARYWYEYGTSPDTSAVLVVQDRLDTKKAMALDER